MKFIIKFLAIVAVLILGLYLGVDLALSPADERLEEEIQVNMTIDYGNGRGYEFLDVNIIKQATVFDLLEQVMRDNNLEFSYRNYGEMGAMIDSVNKVSNSRYEDTWWQFWVNGIYSKVGASGHRLSEGDFVEWKYVAGQINN